jgi:hypothetical protein
VSKKDATTYGIETPPRFYPLTSKVVLTSFRRRVLSDEAGVVKAYDAIVAYRQEKALKEKKKNIKPVF